MLFALVHTQLSRAQDGFFLCQCFVLYFEFFSENSVCLCFLIKVFLNLSLCLYFDQLQTALRYSGLEYHGVMILPLECSDLLGLAIMLMPLQSLRCVGLEVHADVPRSSKCFGIGYRAGALTTFQVSRV